MRRLFVILFSFVAPALYAQGVIEPRLCPPPVCASCIPGRACPCFTPPCNMVAPAMIARTASDVRVELDGRVLRWEVSEKFINRGGRVAEADYLFPLPDDAAFQDLKLSIGGELVAGETMNAADARRIYEEIVRRQRDPALVEWMGRGLLRARIFPLNPGEEKTVVVRFQSVARREGDAVRIEYVRGAHAGPSNVSSGMPGRPLPDEHTSFTIVYPSDATFGRAYSPTHELESGESEGHRTARTRSGSGDVVVLVPVRRSEKSVAVSVLPYAPGNEAGFALVTVTPPATAPRRTPRDVTFVLDVSGSMSGRKMEQARAAGKQLLGTLDTQDRFRVIDFSTDVRSFRDDYVPATRENLTAASRYLDALDAEGSTNIAGALDAALAGERSDSGRMETIFFVTDGEPTVGERDPERLAQRLADRRGSRRIFSFGVGTDVNASLVEQIALRGRGTAHFVRPEESVERAVSLVARQVASPVVTDVTVRLACDGGDCPRLTRAYPSEPADLFAGQELVLLARYEGSGRATVEVNGRTADGPVRWTSAALFPERERANGFVARLWATQRVGWLSAEKRRGGGSAEMDAEIRELGEHYGIPTEFTSYFVREPGMVAGAGGLGSLGRNPVQLNPAMAPMAAPAAARDEAFRGAERAARQRSAITLSAVDSVSSTGRGSAERRLGTHVFVQSDSGWMDTRLTPSLHVVRIRPFSDAYFALLDAIPELRQFLALGDRVTVAGSHTAIAIAPDGADRLDAARVHEIAGGW